MIHLDISILYQVVLFVVLWMILSKLFFKPYISLLEERERKTTGAQLDSSDLEHDAAHLKAQYEERMAKAQASAYAAKDALLQDARQQREKILAQAREDAAKNLDQVRRDVVAALAQEKQLADAEVSRVAQDMVSKVLGRSVS
ncbi:MAG: ATP synthase F0 subunit B [Deltaproteobacteria bacterium]|nr:ATP synthase F0 subunit B [Deltaproteobacteria bacterium]MBM4298979.1 ATP synthase F0 subunit B [Deltaproteobacteria bacterium]